MIGRSISREPPIVALVIAALVATVASSAIAASMDALGLLLVVLLAVGALAVAIMRPILLFYAYCAAIPFNFALPPGPAGTVARIAGLAFFVGYLIREPDSLRPNLVPLVGWLFVGWTLASCLWAIDSGDGLCGLAPSGTAVRHQRAGRDDRRKGSGRYPSCALVVRTIGCRYGRHR